MASLSGGSSALLNSLAVTLGAASYSGLNEASGVTVANSGNITTASHDAPGIIAQSVGGGGGLVRLLANDLETSAGQVTSAPGFTYNLKFGASLCACAGGDAGPVTVTHTGLIITSGNDAHGILAQSIGGGGGAVLGGLPNGSNFVGTDVLYGNGNTVTVTAGSGNGASGAGSIATDGQGAVAVLAQSIGGGGGLAGDLGLTAQRLVFSSAETNTTGDGGAVTVTEYGSATLVTTGNNTPAIVGQSIGGGGGYITNGSGAYGGTFGGAGAGGTVTVNVFGNVYAAGTSSPGIFAESSGLVGYPISVNVYSGGVVQGGEDGKPGDAAGVYLVDGGAAAFPNVVMIQKGGTISSAGGATGTAIYTTGNSYTEVTNDGLIVGNVILDSGTCTGTGAGCPATGTVANRADGVLQASSVRLGGGTLTNAGTFDVRAGGSGAATVVGNYHAVAGGVLQVGADFTKGTADQLTVTGNAQLDPGSAVRVDVANYAKGVVPVLTVNGTLTNGFPVAQASNPSYLFDLQTAQSGNTLQVQTVSNLRSASLGLTATERSVAGILDAMWQSGDPRFRAQTAALATIGDERSYRTSLSNLAGASAGAVAGTKQVTSERFTDNLINCDPYRGAGMILTEESCMWVRSAGTRASLAGAGDDPGYRQDSTLVQLGGQREVAPGWFLGASAGYETSWLAGADDGTSVSGQSALFGAMVKHQTGPWVFSGVVDGGYGWYRSNRQILVGTTGETTSGSPNVGHVGLHGRTSYQTVFSDWYARPSLTLSAFYRNMPGYAESGTSPFDLVVKSRSDVVGAFTPDMEIGRGGDVGGVGTLRGFVGVGMTGYVNNDWSSRAAFQFEPNETFTATARQPGAVARLRAGLDLFTAQGIEAKLAYDAELAPGYAAQSIVGRLTLAF
jgi:hypothetical protein